MSISKKTTGSNQMESFLRQLTSLNKCSKCKLQAGNWFCLHKSKQFCMLSLNSRQQIYFRQISISLSDESSKVESTIHENKSYSAKKGIGVHKDRIH